MVFCREFVVGVNKQIRYGKSTPETVAMSHAIRALVAKVCICEVGLDIVQLEWHRGYILTSKKVILFGGVFYV